ncbi:hypothetical protein EVA_15826 [gut metagenome]|uniref:Uncharacterized protein n=1 Tax=gut metagenome TaxID=749906 RepID=J9G9H1_9ZZZZ
MASPPGSRAIAARTYPRWCASHGHQVRRLRPRRHRLHPRRSHQGERAGPAGPRRRPRRRGAGALRERPPLDDARQGPAERPLAGLARRPQRLGHHERPATST